jgi:hypothetical protein
MADSGSSSRLILASAWLLVGAAMVAVPLWYGWTRGEVVLAGHPVTIAVLLVVFMAGVVALGWAVATLLLTFRGAPGKESQSAALVGIPLLAGSVVVVAVLALARPIPASQPVESAVDLPDTVDVVDRLTWTEIRPNTTTDEGDAVPPTAGLVFLPDARVDARAYTGLLRPLAERGYLVAILKEPLGLSSLYPGHAEAAMEVHPGVSRWVVGGHGLGGSTAAKFANSHDAVSALVLYAAYPAEAVTRQDLTVLSISGSADVRTTSEEVVAAKPLLPPSTRYVVVDGATHSSFGDYAADDISRSSRLIAHGQIRQETAQILTAVAQPAR